MTKIKLSNGLKLQNAAILGTIIFNGLGVFYYFGAPWKGRSCPKVSPISDLRTERSECTVLFNYAASSDEMFVGMEEMDFRD